MEEPPPPPPPPHGAPPRTGRSGGLPDGKYDIFVVPPSSAGSGFLYLPSLNTHRNSFLAGCVCTATSFFLYSVAMPVAKEWFLSTINGGGSGVMMLVVGVAVVSWALGKTQGEGTSTGPSTESFRGTSSSGSERTYGEPPPQPQSEPRSQQSPPPPPREPTPEPASGPEPKPGPEAKKAPEPEMKPDPPQPQSPTPQPKSTWQRPTPGTDAKSAWEKAREETRKREEEKKKAAEIQRRREALEKEKQRQREKETLERLEREWKEKREKEEEAARKADAETKAQQAKDEVDKRLQREKERREREAREALLKAAEEAREAKEALERTRKEEQERREREVREEKSRKDAEAERRAAEEARAADAGARGSNVSSSKRPPMPSARTERDDDAYSFRPYDRPKSTAQKSSSGSQSVYSDDSYAPSASTARTTPPPSTRGPYHTKDPDKVIIKGVYSFNNAFMRTPISQLISGQGNVTDGLILRITTEGLFIDDDVRGVPQREWDVKAWTMKLAETVEIGTNHVLRASIRDSEGKKYVFILDKTEGWKVAVGLQRLRKGSQVRSLGIAGMPTNEAKVLLESLGWT